MNSLKPYALLVVFCLLAWNTNAQSVITLEPGTFSNRTTDGLNNGDTAPANKTWTFYDYTSGWNSQYYNGDITKPGYTESWLCARWSTGQPVTDGFVMNYRLLFPAGYNQAEAYKYPLIIFMHGLGESGQGAGSTTAAKLASNEYLNNDKNLIHGGQAHLNAVYATNGKKAEDPTLPTKSFPGFVLIPQQAVGQWYDGSQTTAAITILKKVIETYNVDPNRVYIHGLSNGGQAVWYMVKSNPELFAAALPMSATVAAGDDIFNSQVNKAVPIPLWMFQGGLDTSPSPNMTGQMVSKLRTAGADVRYTVYPNIGHGVWGTAYAEPDFFSWMLTHNKSDITVLYQNPTICPTTGAGAQLAVGTGFLAYQWEKDGVIISGATSNTYTAVTAGSYRARFSRISATPTEEQWNQWSKPVIVSETAAITPTITTTSSPHLPDINAINSPSLPSYTIRIEGPTDADLDKDWYENGSLQSGENSYRELTFNQWNIVNPTTLTQTLKVKQLSGCPSLLSNSIYVTLGTPTTLSAPTNLQATVTGSGSIQLFWTDNANNETGYEIQRATDPTGPYTFYKLVGEDVVAYHDTGLVPNTTYYYKIRAVNNTATSPYNSSNLVAETFDDTIPPSAPQNLVKIVNSISSIKLGWESSTDNSGIKKYLIYYGGNTIDTGSADTTYTITDLAFNTNYIFTVKAVDNNDNLSQPSNQLTASTVFSGLDYEHTPDNVGDGNLHSPENSVYGIDWGYKEHSGHVDNVTIAPRVQDNYFNFKFNGYLKVPTGGQYSFRISANDAAALYLGTNFPYRNTSTALAYPGVYSYWSAMNTGLTNTTVRYINPNISNTAFAATNGGVFKATFNTTTGVWNAWTSSSNGLTNTDVRFMLNVTSTTFLAATAGGVFRSTDAGVTWTEKNTNLTNLDVRHLNVNGSTIYASTAGGVFVTTNNGDTWTAMNSGLTNTNVRYIANNGTNIYAATAGGMFLSVSGGSWSVKNTGLTNTDVRCVNIQGSSVFAGTAGGLFISAISGSTVNWSTINTGLANTSILSIAQVSNGANNLFVGTSSGAYMFSYTVQNSWTARPIGLANTNVNFLSISGGNMFASTPTGTMLSINSGANWASTNRITQVTNSSGVNTCQQATSTNYTLATDVFYPISIIYYDLVDDECLTLEYKLGSGAWTPVPDSFFSSGSTPAITTPLVPSNLVASSMGMSSIQLTWSHVSTTDDFEIYRSTDNVNYTIVATITTDDLRTFTDTSLTPATQHFYKIRAINAAGGLSAFTDPVNATTDPDSEAPTVPTNLTVVTNTYTNAGLQWTASTDNVQVAGYKIYANGDLLGTSNVTTYFTTALSLSTSYTFTVKAYDLNGNESAASTGASIVTPGPATFYSKNGADLTSLSSWTTDINGGTGTAPTSFSLNGQQFVIRANNNTISSSWSIGGSVSRVSVKNNIGLSLTNSITGKINLGDNATLTVNANVTPDLDVLSATSKVIYNTNYTSVAAAKYGNLELRGSGIKTIAQGILEVAGDFTVGNNVELKGAAGNGTVIEVKGNIITGTTTPTVPADNLVGLQFSDGESHNFTIYSDQNFYKITAGTNSSITIDNQSGAARTIKIGSLNSGGGIELGAGSYFSIGSNDLIVTGSSSINPSNTTGQLSVQNGNIQLLSTSSLPSNLYFFEGENKVKNLTLQSTGGGLTTIRQPLEIYDGLTISSGVLEASGNVIIKSSATASASIRQIVSGAITGNVVVERYMAPSGRIYRYLSSPVEGFRVDSLQKYIPVTGAFAGSSTGAGLGSNPSMYTYTEPNYVAFPVSDNTEQFQKGKGYSVYVRDTALPTLISSGVPYQGTVSFTSLLTPGTGSSTDGWNLLGNPYASDIVWNSASWTSSGISNIIAISDNTSGVLQYHYWDRSGSGSGGLQGGKIPAGQAFWVQTLNASPSLSVNESAKTTDAATLNTQFYRTSAARTGAVSSFSFELDNGVHKDVAYLKFTDDGVDNYSKLNDGVKRANSFFNISTSSLDNVALAMNDLSKEFCEKTIPINLQNTAAGTYTLRFNGIDDFNLGIVTLEDRYMSTTQVISSQNKEFTINVDSQAASTQNRFFLKLTHADVITNKSVVADKNNFCASENMVTLTIQNSQPEVVYEAFLTSSVSEKVTGTGEAIQLQVPVSALANNANVISVKAAYPGCTASTMARTATVNKTASPEITGDTEYYGCVDSSMDIKVSSASAVSYQWTNQLTDQVLADTDNSITLSSVLPSNYYKVVAIDNKGCESAAKYILVRADSLTTPVVTAVGEVLKTSSKTNIQWLLNGEVIDGATGVEFTPQVSGSYSVRTDNNYCTKESVPLEYIVTGIGEAGNEEFSISIYPNPTSSGNIHVSGKSKSSTPVQLQLFDLTGKNQVTKVMSYTDFAKGVTVEEELSAGMYIVKVLQDNKTLHQKLVVH
jgi:predicted esterase/chitodextrinase